MTSFNVITSDFVNVNITTSAQQTSCIERRFQKGICIDDFKGKLELVTGGNPATMKLEVYDKNDKFVCCPNEGSRLLGSYPIDDGMTIHVIDDFIPTDDLSNVEKFTISEEEYSKRPDTVKAFLEKNQLGKYNEEEMKKKEEEMKKKEEERKQEREMEEELVKSFNPGDRCEVRVPSQPTRRAAIMYIGKTDFKKGLWVGVKYDEPLGKNDGSVNGKRYFECPPKYGGFVKPCHVIIGDFPEENYNLNEEL